MDNFEWRIELATGLTLHDALALGRALSERRADLIREAGYCCEAGATAYSPSPEAPTLPCPWHGPLHPIPAKHQN